MARRPIGEQAPLLLLDPVLHLAPLAVHLVVQLLRVPGTFTTTNRGLASWAVCSALTITRRRRSQLDAAYENDPKSRCGWPVRRNCRAARSIQSRAWRSSTAFLARPRT